MAESLTLAVRNQQDAIAPASAQAEAWLEQHHADSKSVHLVLLAIEEMVTNCIKYGYEDGAEHTIHISLAVEGRTLTIDVRDDGRPFDPLTAPAADVEASAEDRQMGGLGLLLLRGLSDHVAYGRRDGINRLTLVRNLVNQVDRKPPHAGPASGLI